MNRDEAYKEIVRKVQTAKLTDSDGRVIEINEDEKQKLLNEGKIKILSIPKYENAKINLNEYLRRYKEFINKFPSAPNDIENKLYIDLNELLHRTSTSFTTPGFYLNKYIDSLIKYNIYNINRENLEKGRSLLMSVTFM